MQIISQTEISHFFINSLVQQVKNGVFSPAVLLSPDAWNTLLNDSDDIKLDIQGMNVEQVMLDDGEIIILYEFNNDLTTTLFASILRDHYSLYYVSLERIDNQSVFRIWDNHNDYEDKECDAVSKEGFLTVLSKVYHHQCTKSLNEIANDKLVFDKLSPEEVTSILMQFKGLSRESAESIVNTELQNLEKEQIERAANQKIYQKKHNKEERVNGRRDILWGIIWIACALLGSFAMWMLADYLGFGWYIGFVGAFWYGVIRLFRGIGKQFKW